AGEGRVEGRRATGGWETDARPRITEGRSPGTKRLGLSWERLQRISTVFHADVERGIIPGAVLLIARGGQIAYAEAFGWRDKEKQAPMRVASSDAAPASAARCPSAMQDWCAGARGGGRG